jgi:hypothetical protein
MRSAPNLLGRVTEVAKLCAAYNSMNVPTCVPRAEIMIIKHCVAFLTGRIRPLFPALFILACHFPLASTAQSMFLPQDNKHLPFLNRLEILLQKDPLLNISSPKTLTRYSAVYVAGMEDSSSGKPSIRLSAVDQQNLRSLLLNNAEYITRVKSEKPRSFFDNPANMVEVNKPGFFLAVNPMLQTQAYLPNDDGNDVNMISAGLGFRTLINENLGFYASAVRNYENPPVFARNLYTQYNAVPGAGPFEVSDNRYQFFDFRGGVTFKALRYFDFQIALDRNFIGNGYRSLFLSDFSTSHLFAKVNTTVWRFKYQHLYSPLVPSFTGEREFTKPFGKKVVAMHHLSINATNWLNVAIFQALAITTNKDWHYMIPIMFYPVNTLNKNKPENNLGGFEFKANVARRAQFYGQVIIDNLKFKEFKSGNGWWNNRYGLQAGVKYINAFGIDNLDLQLETNSIRPYTYSTSDSAGTYAHYNQPLAHPMGANLSEGIAILRYQPSARLMATLKAITWQQGVDSGGVNFGGNILKGHATRPAEYGYSIPTGVSSKGTNLQLLLSYEFFENIFIDAAILVRNQRFENNVRPKMTTTLGNIGARMNLFRRDYDY